MTAPAVQSKLTPKHAEPTAPSADIVRVGMLLPLSGPYADVGRALLNAAAVSLFDTGDKRLVLVPRDTRGTAEGAQQAVNALVAEGVDVIAGPLLAAEVRAAAVALKAAGSDIRLIGFSSDRSVAGGGVYLLSFMPEEEVRRVVEYAAAEGKKSFAALVPETPYGDTVGRAFRAKVAAVGGSVADYVIYPPDAKGVMNPVKRIAHYDARVKAKAAEMTYLKTLADDPAAMQAARASRPNPMALPYQALLLPEGAALMRVMVPLLSYYDIDPGSVQLLGTGVWNDPSLARDPQLRGSWFAAPPQDKAQAFMDRYRSLYRSEPPRIATLAYDAVALVDSLADGAKDTRFSDAALTDGNGFTGIDGIFRFTRDGVSERGLAVMTFGADGISLVSPAPTSFDSSTQ
nr:penicillin-binding protein activator [Govania unica]